MFNDLRQFVRTVVTLALNLINVSSRVCHGMEHQTKIEVNLNVNGKDAESLSQGRNISQTT